MRQHVFIIGSKGIPAHYGGFESFVDRLTYYKKNGDIQYHVSCLADSDQWNKSEKVFKYNGARCFRVKEVKIGPAKAVLYDLYALRYCLRYIRGNHIEHPIIYILACRIGPFIGWYKKQIEMLGGCLYVNPDGHEWKRSKWSLPVKKYWKLSEKFMVKHADLLICDSKNIEKYIRETYKAYHPNTTFIAYGSETRETAQNRDNEKLEKWYQDKDLAPNNYYLVVGRFVPENNYETMIREFMHSSSEKDLVLITGIEWKKFYDRLKKRTGFETDKRIKFVGTVYDTELLMKIRENAYGYLHGHEVGGTNPSLLEALESTKVNLLLDVGFNREVGKDCALYWNKSENNLAKLIDCVDDMPDEERELLGKKAKKRIEKWYSWDYIVEQYERSFIMKMEYGSVASEQV